MMAWRERDIIRVVHLVLSNHHQVPRATQRLGRIAPSVF